MIKIVFCLTRKEPLTRAEFARYWREEHAELVRVHADALRIRRYTQSHTLSDPRLEPAVLARTPDGGDYDGVAELWWDGVDDIVAAQGTTEGRAAGRALIEDERRFIDLERSRIFFTEEHAVI